jgi:hypothetical protein
MRVLGLRAASSPSCSAHHALSKPGAGDDWVLFNGLSTIATGLEILSAELKATRKEIAELKTLLQQPPKRTP